MIAYNKTRGFTITRFFLSDFRRFIRVPPEETYDKLIRYIYSDTKAKRIHVRKEDVSVTAKLLNEIFGINMNICVIPEKEASTVRFNFRYRNFILFFFACLIPTVALTTVLGTMMLFFGVALLFVLTYMVGHAASHFLDLAIEFLFHLENEYSRRLLAESRRRWKSTPKDLDVLYAKLREKHIKTWGDTYVLKYKIDDYMRKGLTREEAIRKICEDEGVFI